MSTWEERMSRRHHRNLDPEVTRKRAEYLGKAMVRYWPPDDGMRYGFDPVPEILPEIIAARCLGIEYGDPGPRHGPEVCRECWGERTVWLGNCWGWRHAGDTMSGCEHPCHADEVWMASAG